MEMNQYLDKLLVLYVEVRGGERMNDNIDYKLEFSQLIEMIPSALYVIKDSKIIDCNESALRIFGYDDKDEIIGLQPYVLSPERQKDGSLSVAKGQEIIDNIVNTKKDKMFKWIHKRKNGELFLADIKIFNKNNILYAIVIDIDEKDQLKRDLNEKDYIYNMLFENHNSMMLIIEPTTGNIVEANQTAIDYYGYTNDELLSMRIQDINILNEEQVKKEMKRAQSERRSYFQFVHRLANDEKREVEVHSFPIKTKKGKLLFSIIYDISDKLKQKLMFDTLFFDSPYGVAILDKDQKVVNINKNFTNLFQFELEEIQNKPLCKLVLSSDNKSQIDNNVQLIYKGEVIRQEGVRKRKDGKLIEVEIICYPVINHQELIGACLIYIDISDRKAYERQLLLFKKILENNSEGVVITDTKGHIEWVNNAFSQITGYSSEEVLDKNISILDSGIHNGAFYREMRNQLISKGEWTGEIWNRNKTGDIYPEWLTIRSIKTDSKNTNHYVSIFKDISEKKKIDRRMNYLQQRDSLTGLYNRNYFIEMIDTLIDNYHGRKDEFSILVINIEGFKEINNSLGHIIGDKILIELSKKLLLLMNDDYILARFSGDEFAILCKPITKEDARFFAKVLLKYINEPLEIDNTILHLTANIGISRFPYNGIDAENLIRYADIAMYKAKGKVEDKICFYSKEMSKESEDKFLVANHLARAVSNRELSIYYQPIVDINNQQKIVGLEALLRWKNPILGMVSPGKFIPIAEKTGHILAIGEWALNEVCKQINTWQKLGHSVIPVAVNISVKQLEQAELAKIVIAIMERNNIDSKYIELEITESVSSGDIITIVRNLKELKNFGIKISMDDFGTGFSSLGQLDLFELDKLKIDKIFIDDLVNASKRQNLVKLIITMARSLNLKVVAEGIETKEQLHCLKEMGCQLGQGYYFSKPLPAEKIEAVLYSTNRAM